MKTVFNSINRAATVLLCIIGALCGLVLGNVAVSWRGLPSGSLPAQTVPLIGAVLGICLVFVVRKYVVDKRDRAISRRQFAEQLDRGPHYYGPSSAR